jgi:hypothetical protein
MDTPKTPISPKSPHDKTESNAYADIKSQVAAAPTLPVASAPAAEDLPNPVEKAEPTDFDVLKAMSGAGVTSEQLEKAIHAVLDARKEKVLDGFKAKEPDYATLSEKDIYGAGIYIPVVEHEIPEYMAIQLKDPEYVPVWASKDQRRLGQLLAEGYEFIKPEHIHPNFLCPLKFDSEGMYRYVDVIAMRVHKRIRFAKLRAIALRSAQQLKPAQAQANAKAELVEKVILGDPGLDHAFSSGSMGFYSTTSK